MALSRHPGVGLMMGEMFYLKELGEDCSSDRVYEFFLFCGPPLVMTGETRLFDQSPGNQVCV